MLYSIIWWRAVHKIYTSYAVSNATSAIHHGEGIIGHDGLAWTILEHWVPFPAPGPPSTNTTHGFAEADIAAFLHVCGTSLGATDDSSGRQRRERAARQRARDVGIYPRYCAIT